MFKILKNLKDRNLKNKKGFSLIEMLVVLIIIGVLMTTMLGRLSTWEEPFKIEMVKFFNNIYLSVDNFPFDKKSDFRANMNNKVENVIIKMNNTGIEDYQYYTFNENRLSLYEDHTLTNKPLINLWKNGSNKDTLVYNDSTILNEYRTTYGADLDGGIDGEVSGITGKIGSSTQLEMVRCLINESDEREAIEFDITDITNGFYILVDRKGFYISKTLNNNYINGVGKNNLTFTENDILQIENMSCFFKVDENEKKKVLVRFF